MQPANQTSTATYGANGATGGTVTGGTFAIGPGNAPGPGNVTPYPQSPPGATHQITYDGNGSTSGFGPSDPSQYLPGDTVTVLGNLGFLFKPGYVMTGWNTAADGSGIAYETGTTFAMGTNDVTLYAQWSPGNWPPVSIWGGAREVITLKADGTVWTWGLNASGELGNGNTNDSWIPVQVLGAGGSGILNNVTAVMGGELHNVALKSDGTVWTWGSNITNQLGNGMPAGKANNSLTPVQVSGLTSVVKLGSRGYHSVAVKSDGTVWAWGWDRYGALGNGIDDANFDYPVPVQVQGVNNPIMVTAGYLFGVALLQDHTLVAWGDNLNGTIGDGTTTNRLTAVPVTGIDNVVWVSAGWTHVVAIRADGTVWTWGQNVWNGAFDMCNGVFCGYGKLGDGTTNDHHSPKQVAGLSGAIMALAGDSSTSVLLRDGTVWTFGSNGAGQLAVPGINQSLVPVQVQGLCHAVYIMTRDFHNEALCQDGTLWSWGSGDNGELGNNTNSNSVTPVEVKAY